MHLHIINNIIGLQEVNFINLEIDHLDSAMYLWAEVVNVIQACPHGGDLEHVILKGKRSLTRKVRHLDSFSFKCFFILPESRLYCKGCNSWFTYSYDFITERSSYTHDFKKAVSIASTGSTLNYVATHFQLPETTCSRIVKEYLEEAIPLVQEVIIDQASNTKKLVLGVDDFAIRKGHNYNTGFHDLRNGTFLKVVLGRTFDQLINNESLKEMLSRLQPVAVVMDLAKSYHKFIDIIFPDALRIADRFHVNRYITDALQEVRKRLSTDKKYPAEVRK